MRLWKRMERRGIVRIYMDVCCLSRPYDNQQSDRIKLESEAILLILFHCQQKSWQLVDSDIINIEIAKISNIVKKQKVSSFLDLAFEKIALDDDIELRSAILQNFGIGLFDSLHIASAEKAKVDIMLSTDDILVKKAKQIRDLTITVENPVKWLMEVINDEPYEQGSFINKKDGI
jgi:predicted nucleic acid-binding protein